MAAHTPTPWEIAPHSDSDERLEICAGYRELGSGQSQADWIAELDAANLDGGIDTNCANAEFIVRACNSHGDLLAALRDIVSGVLFEPSREDFAVDIRGTLAYRRACDMWRAGKAAVAKAEGK